GSLRAPRPRHGRPYDARRTLRYRVPLGEGWNRQRVGDEPTARHRAARRIPHRRRERTARIRLVLRTGRTLDDARYDVGRRFRHDARGTGVSAEVPATGWKDSTRDLAVGIARAVVRPVSVCVGERGCDAVVRNCACRLLALEWRSRVP